MNTQGVKRKLTAIHSADIKGYSRLMREDEVSTVDAITVWPFFLTPGKEQCKNGFKYEVTPNDKCRMTPERIEGELIPAVIETTKEISTRLGYLG